jgi:ubiquinone/menaquinone biosynthesis C-methylase UbiE
MTAAGGASGYVLTLSEDELRRYRFMADAARQIEQDLWQTAGITPGATVADVGCGPGALFPRSWTRSGLAVASSESTGTPEPSQRRRP